MVIPKLTYIKFFWLKAGRGDFLGIVIQIVSAESQFYILPIATKNFTLAYKKAALSVGTKRWVRLAAAL
ncbi:hypothetical protein BVG97_06585 [Serratia marcescens]|nr:hypothetical protein B0W01_02520 [Serratia marcescens]ASL87270.1 hypothetical protein BVG97_06585 [Serratia marcescens]